ncbi:MAG: exodeoxyribonuclease VII small subunit [Christensenellales bacterium]
MNLNEKIEKLEVISSSLEKEDIDLNDAVGLFDEGVKTLKECYDFLDTAQGKITILKKELDNYAEKDFKTEEE